MLQPVPVRLDVGHARTQGEDLEQALIIGRVADAADTLAGLVRIDAVLQQPREGGALLRVRSQPGIDVDRARCGLRTACPDGLYQTLDAVGWHAFAMLADVDGDFAQPISLIQCQVQAGMILEQRLDVREKPGLIGAQFSHRSGSLHPESTVQAVHHEGTVFADHGIERPSLREMVAPARTGAGHGHDSQSGRSQTLERHQGLRWQASVQGQRVIDIGQDPSDAAPGSGQQGAAGGREARGRWPRGSVRKRAHRSPVVRARRTR